MSLQKTGAKNTNKFRMFKYVNKKKGMLIEYFANLKDNIMHPEHTTTKFTAVIFTLDKISLQCNMMFHLLKFFFDNKEISAPESKKKIVGTLFNECCIIGRVG